MRTANTYTNPLNKTAMKKKWILWGIAAAVAAVLLWAWPRYALIGILGLLAGWIGRVVFAKRTAR